ncbi:MAG: PGPGW domain-containing protein [Acidobacteriota bacterium]|jgi:uncharacterized protein (TIGR02611 family)|nr:PGPGW domain-containing protein [Acidobacteriota bacterium]
MRDMLKFARRVIVLVVGVTVVLTGVVMLVTPGPGWGAIFAGLAILATEYAWARRWLRAIRATAEKGADKLGLRPFFEEFSKRHRWFRVLVDAAVRVAGRVRSLFRRGK